MHFTDRTRQALGALAILLAATSQPVQAGGLTYIGQQIVPSGTMFSGTTVGGLSGIDRVATSGRFLSIADDRSAHPLMWRAQGRESSNCLIGEQQRRQQYGP